MKVDYASPIVRQADGECFCIHFSGGIRAHRTLVGGAVRWVVGPVRYEGKVSRIGFLSESELKKLARDIGVTSIALQSFGWHEGSYSSRWYPILLDRKDHSQGPSDLWGHIAANILGERSNATLSAMGNPSFDKVANVIDKYTSQERLARSISLNLRGMDVNVEQISEFYNEQLTNHLFSGKSDEVKWSDPAQDPILSVHIHSFFLHFGAARDYLGELIAHRIGAKDPKKRRLDSMEKLRRALGTISSSNDPLLDLLKTKNLVRPPVAQETEWQLDGWLAEASTLRNRFVHKRPYGMLFAEGWGYVKGPSVENGLQKYVRPLISENQNLDDVFDKILSVYANLNLLFQLLAENCGLNAGIIRIHSKDIISIEI